MPETITPDAPATIDTAPQTTSWGEDMAAMLKTPELGEPISDVMEPKVVGKTEEAGEEKPKAGVKIASDDAEPTDGAKPKDVIKFRGYELDVTGKTKKERAVLQSLADESNAKKSESDSIAYLKQELAEIKGKVANPTTKEAETQGKEEHFDEIDETAFENLVGMAEILEPLQQYEGKEAFAKSLESAIHRAAQLGFLYGEQKRQKEGVNGDLVKRVAFLEEQLEETREIKEPPPQTLRDMKAYALDNDPQMDTAKAAIAFEKQLKTDIRAWEKIQGKKFDREQLGDPEVRSGLIAAFFETYEPEKIEPSEAPKKAVSAKGMPAGKTPNDKTLRAPLSGRGDKGGSSPVTGHGRFQPNPAQAAEAKVFNGL